MYRKKFYHVFHEAQIKSTPSVLAQTKASSFTSSPHALKIRHKSKMKYLRRKICVRDIIEFQSNTYVFQNIVSFYLDTIRFIYSFLHGFAQKYNIKYDKKSVALSQ